MKELISKADLIIYPISSFYSSLVANLLPVGVSASIRDNPCPKVFIPNPVNNSELTGKTLTDQINELIFYLKQHESKNTTTNQLLNFILVDEINGNYPGGIDYDQINSLGVKVIHYPIISNKSEPYLDASRLNPILLSLV